ncbi:hypothetical protein J1N35_040425 [Gossypium stocksii]|uniref:Uncharacterized protein n=1 Tax=Gossypium stocksii TaxID=47602 RepID=A0A9D3ZIC2_9ROSI|nr:hypothetical protein J1N35_040425 [Gossypium stocksii]
MLTEGTNNGRESLMWFFKQQGLPHINTILHGQAIIDLHRSSNIAKATKDKALAIVGKWKASKKKAREDAKFWQDKAKKYKTKRDTTQVVEASDLGMRKAILGIQLPHRPIYMYDLNLNPFKCITSYEEKNIGFNISNPDGPSGMSYHSQHPAW